ncbi:Beta-chimaerin [Termitomyces sp. J132]|nr:Beta-chimaerin [Termitomyces sp. J132]
MLALVNTSQRDVPRPQSHVRQDITSPTVPEATVLEDRLCPGCKNPAVNEQGGLVVAFGQSFFHVDCFKCAKCGDKVTADTNLLLLSDGSPICTNCTYSCNVCRLPILDEAIMTGDDSYHAHCFKCKVCKSRIDDLVFAKTSQGVYCMNCHNERMAKIRSHVQKKAEREREKRAGGSGSTKSRERAARDHHAGNNGVSAHQAQSSSSSFQPTPSSSLYPSQSISVTTAPPIEPNRPPPLHLIEPSITSEVECLNPVKQRTLPVPGVSQDTPGERRRSYDDGVRPLNVLFGKESSIHKTSDNPLTTPVVSNGLTARPSRRDKRHSINPGISLPELNTHTSTQISQFTVSPHSISSPANTSADRVPTLLSENGRESHPSLSPLREEFPSKFPSSLRSTSHDNLQWSNSSRHSSSSGLAYADEQELSRTKELEVLRSQRSPDSIQHAESRRTSTASLGAQAQPRSRSVSPAHVPQNVESETNTDLEAESPEDQTHFQESLPSLSLKDAKGSSTLKEASVAEEADMTSPSVESGSEDLSESSPVEYTSHSTFIAPALPPIRLSLSSNDFSELLNSVGGFPSRISLSQLTKIPEGEKSEARNDAPPPPTKPSKVNGVFRRPSSSSASDSSHSSRPKPAPKSEHVDVSTVSPTTHNRSVSMKTRITLTGPDSKMSTTLSEDGTDITVVRLQEAVADARDRGAQHLKMDRGFVEAILSTLETQKMEYLQLRSKFDGVKRTSKQYIEGLTVAQTEYDRELKARRDAEAEVTRLRVLLSGKVAKLTVLSGDNRKEKLRQQLSKELHDSLSGLELDLSNLKVERDMALAEVEELEATKRSLKLASGSSEMPPANLGRSLTKRLESIKHQYKRDLLPLTREKESLQREIAELKAVRDVFLEETTVLNARNEELAQLSAAYSRRMETVPEVYPTTNDYHDHGRGLSQLPYQSQQVNISHSLSSSTSSTLHDETMDLRSVKLHKQESDPTPSRSKFMNMKWGSRAKELTSPQAVATGERKIALIPHNFQQLSILRFTRCDHCGDKMWGSQLRCTVCPISTHVRCVNHLQISCIQQASNVQSELIPASLLPSMFGRDLIEQARADARGEDRQVPVIVEKCIQAVEAIALEYEGIYRKTGGAGQSKLITQLFERGDYTSFDLRDSDRFNDICSVTSVLKNYFRSLPVPLLTYDHHDDFMTAVQIKDHAARDATLLNLVNKLPDVHYYTLRMLMLHLHRVRDFADINKMNARNIGVVFGPTLMRPRDPAQEFNDMAGKAIAIEWLVENAPRIFNIQDNSGYQA